MSSNYERAWNVDAVPTSLASEFKRLLFATATVETCLFCKLPALGAQRVPVMGCDFYACAPCYKKHSVPASGTCSDECWNGLCRPDLLDIERRATQGLMARGILYQDMPVEPKRSFISRFLSLLTP